MTSQAYTRRAGAPVLQLTDLHLFADPDARQHGWHTQAAFEAVLEAALARYPQPRALLLTGDLVHDESAIGYQRLARRLGAIDAPVFAIPGNHDAPDTMRRCMPGVQVGGSAHLDGWQLQLLNSHVAGSDSGRLGRAQLQRLHSALARDPAPALIACHHPPAPVGSAWLDAMCLADGDALLDGLAGGSTRAIVCGHVHQFSDRQVDGVRQLTTPATCRQFAPGRDSPGEDRRRAPGYRVLRLGPDGRLRSRVHRVPAARLAAYASYPDCL